MNKFEMLVCPECNCFPIKTEVEHSRYGASTEVLAIDEKSNKLVYTEVDWNEGDWCVESRVCSACKSRLKVVSIPQHLAELMVKYADAMGADEIEIIRYKSGKINLKAIERALREELIKTLL